MYIRTTHLFDGKSGRTFRKLSFLLCLSFCSLGYKTESNTKSAPEARVGDGAYMLTFSLSFLLGLRSVTLSTNLSKSAEVCFGLIRLSLNM